MTGSGDPTDQGTGPQTDQERELLAAYRELDEADRVLLWNAMLTELGQGSYPEPDEESCS